MKSSRPQKQQFETRCKDKINKDMISLELISSGVIKLEHLKLGSSFNRSLGSEIFCQLPNLSGELSCTSTFIEDVHFLVGKNFQTRNQAKFAWQIERLLLENFSIRSSNQRRLLDAFQVLKRLGLSETQSLPVCSVSDVRIN